MNYQLYHGDCLEVMPTLPDNSIDAIIADLPYGTTALSWDSVIPLEPLWAEYKRLIKPRGAAVLFGSQPFTSALVMSNPGWFKYSLTWIKNRPVGFANVKKRPLKKTEDVLIFYQSSAVYNPQGVRRIDKTVKNSTPKRLRQRNRTNQDGGAFHLYYVQEYTDYPDDVLSFDVERTLHPTQKPVALIEFLVKTYTNPGDLVLDNVFGSCTTGVACLNTGRRFIGIEKDADYFQIGKERMDKRAAELRGEYVQPKATEPIDNLPLFQEQPQ